jgi:hypothetical protein
MASATRERPSTAATSVVDCARRNREHGSSAHGTYLPRLALVNGTRIADAKLTVTPGGAILEGECRESLGPQPAAGYECVAEAVGWRSLAVGGQRAAPWHECSRQPRRRSVEISKT